MTILGRGKTILIFVLAPVFIYIGILNLSDRTGWKVPSDGIRFVQTEEGPRVAELFSPSLPVGIEKGDLLVDINGLTISSVDEYIEVVEALTQTGEAQIVADYTFEAVDDDQALATYPVRIRQEAQLSSEDIPVTVVGFAFLVIGVFVYLRSARAPGSFHFVLICIVAYSLFVFRYSGRADFFDIGIYWLSQLSFLLLPPIFLHFCAAFPRQSPLLARQQVRRLVLYLPAGLLLMIHLAWFLGELQPMGLPRTPTVGRFLDKVELTHFVLFLAFAAAILVHSRMSVRSAVPRKQMQWISAGTLAGLIPFSLLYVVPYLLDAEITGWMEASVLSLILIPLTFSL